MSEQLVLVAEWAGGLAATCLFQSFTGSVQPLRVGVEGIRAGGAVCGLLIGLAVLFTAHLVSIPRLTGAARPWTGPGPGKAGPGVVGRVGV